MLYNPHNKATRAAQAVYQRKGSILFKSTQQQALRDVQGTTALLL